MKIGTNTFSIGSNSNGQLGIDPKTSHSKQIVEIEFQVKKSENLITERLKIKQIACGTAHTLALTTDNKLFSWGCNLGKELGRKGIEYAPAQVKLPHMNKVKSDHPPQQIIIDKIGCGDSSSFVLTGNGDLLGWGVFNDENGNQIGFFDRFASTELEEMRSVDEKTIHQMRREKLIAVEQLADKPILICAKVLDFSITKNHMFYKTEDGLFTLGVNQFGERGTAPLKRKSNIEQIIPSLFANTRGKLYVYDFIHCGPSATYIIKDGLVIAFGRNGNGQFGLGDRKSGPKKRMFAVGESIKDIKIEENHSGNKQVIEKCELDVFSNPEETLSHKKADKKTDTLSKKGAGEVSEDKPVKDDEELLRVVEEFDEGSDQVENYDENLIKPLGNNAVSVQVGGESEEDLQEAEQIRNEQAETSHSTDDNEEIELKITLPHLKIHSKRSSESEKIVKISTGNTHTLFLTSSGHLYGAGNNNHHQLNTGVRSISYKLRYITDQIVDIVSNGNFSAVKKSNGFWYSFGSNSFGQLAHSRRNMSLMEIGPEEVDLFLGGNFVIGMRK